MRPDHLVRRQIWDPAIRLWHWLFAAAVITGWWLGEFMAFDTIRWHFYTGYTILGLLAFRLLWGLIGPRPVRFRQLFHSRAALAQAVHSLPERKPGGSAGHNPLGSLSVLAMLLAVAAQAITGLFIESEEFFEYGPLSGMVADATVYQLTAWHHRLSKLVLALVILHLFAIGYYWLWKRENLILPMLTGWKWVRKKPAP